MLNGIQSFFFGKNNAHFFHFVKSVHCHEKWNIIEFYSWNKVYFGLEKLF